MNAKQWEGWDERDSFDKDTFICLFENPNDGGDEGFTTTRPIKWSVFSKVLLIKSSLLERVKMRCAYIKKRLFRKYNSRIALEETLMKSEKLLEKISRKEILSRKYEPINSCMDGEDDYFTMTKEMVDILLNKNVEWHTTIVIRLNKEAKRREILSRKFGRREILSRKFGPITPHSGYYIGIWQDSSKVKGVPATTHIQIDPTG